MTGRLHPFTPFVLVLAVAALAFLLPAPPGPVGLYAVVVVAAVLGGHRRAAARAALLCLPLWLFLLLLLGVLHGGSGYGAAAAQGARLGAVITASLMLYDGFAPSRFLDAVAARGWSFHAAYLVVATLQAAPRLRDRAAGILEAQRARGLRVAGGLAGRVRALVPVTLPLVLGVLSDLDEQAMALDTRAAGAGARTPLTVPQVSRTDRVVRWLAAAAVVGAAAWRVVR